MEPGRLPNLRKTCVVPEEVTIGVILAPRPQRRDHVPFYGGRDQVRRAAVPNLTLVATPALTPASAFGTVATRGQSKIGDSCVDG